jgi:hypothetical protein
LPGLQERLELVGSGQSPGRADGMTVAASIEPPEGLEDLHVQSASATFRVSMMVAF